jgi:hypothetical protein
MISHKHKCIFIHIPKTAGTSIENKLGHFQEFRRGIQDHRPISMLEPGYLLDVTKLALRGDVQPFVQYVRQMAKRKSFVLPHQYNTYFKFTFVRNSWARVFSWYNNVIRDGRKRTRLNVSDSCTFKEFLNNHLDQWALNSQLFWISDRNGKIAMDFIGRYEKLEEDFSYVCNTLRIKDVNLPRLIAGDGRPYTHFYDEETKAIVARKYAEEIAFFKFEFAA